ncbi:MAG: hypothetical protein QOJ45_392 [Verrucomicrobiota bacterium]
MSVRLTVKLDITLNCILNVFESLVDIRTLRMTTWQLRTTDRNTFVMGQQSDMKFPLHVISTYAARARQSTIGRSRTTA